MLAGSNADEGTKALMYFSPYLFPNREMERTALSRHDFASTVDKIFAHLSKQVRNSSHFVSPSLYEGSFFFPDFWTPYPMTPL